MHVVACYVPGAKHNISLPLKSKKTLLFSCNIATMKIYFGILLAVSTVITLVYVGIQANTNEQRSSTNKDLKYWPIQDISYSASGSNTDKAVFVVPRRVYYDTRPQQNNVIILAEVHDKAVDTILACELNGKYSKSINKLKENTWWVRRNCPGCTHLALVIQCKGLPQDAIFNGSIAKLIYRKKDEDFYSRVGSDKPLFLHNFGRSSSTPAKGKGSIVVCTTMFDHPKHFDQWLMYQRHLGVEGVHINAHASFSDKASFVYPYYNKSLSNGFAWTETWSDVLGFRAFYFSQKLKYLDCLYRHIGVFEYGIFYDCDDFFNPVIPQQSKIHHYLSPLKNASICSICFSWWEMKCGPIEEKIKDLQHGNITDILSGYDSKRKQEHKCAHHLDKVFFIEEHQSTYSLKHTDSRFLRTRSPAYVAHNRQNTKICNKR